MKLNPKIIVEKLSGLTELEKTIEEQLQSPLHPQVIDMMKELHAMVIRGKQDLKQKLC
jgi:hypothetical protein